MHSPIARALEAITKNRARALLAALAVVFCAVWISQTWSLSSYGHVLRAFQAKDDGIVLGTPRGIISDEWGVVTPWIQATVNNGLARYNKTSYYGEDLRMGVSLPVLDWGLVFKPDKWLYPFVNAAYAYSFQALFFVGTFLVGYALLFRRFGASPIESALLSLMLFWTAFVQIWWGDFAGTVALFPWIVLALDIQRPALQFVALFWVAAAWMIVYFYPPMFIPLAITAAAIFLTLHFRRDRPLATIVPALATLCACLVVVYYLRDYLTATASTVFPGQRRVNGGGVPAEMFADLLWPGGHLVGDFETTTKFNVAEASVVGTIYPLLLLAFLDYRSTFAATVDARMRRTMIAMLVAFGILTAWQVLPIPANWALWTGLPWVLARRSMFACGLALLLFAVLLVRAYGVTFSFRRYLLLCAIVLFGWGVTKANTNGDFWARAWPDLLVIPIAAVTLIPHRWVQQQRNVVVAACCALFGMLAFGGFNPLQKAWPIFNREPTPLTRSLDERANATPNHVLVSNQFGATLNGWGYRSVAHVLIVPPLAIWRELFPDLDPVKFNHIFNRFAHVTPIDEPEPRILQINVVGVPISRFVGPRANDAAVDPSVVRAQRIAGAVERDNRNGHVDLRRQNGNRIMLSGWAPWKGLNPEQSLVVLADVDAKVVRFRREQRPDVVAVHHDASLLYSGFTVEVEVPPAAGGASARICLVARQDASAPRTLIEEEGGECLK